MEYQRRTHVVFYTDDPEDALEDREVDRRDISAIEIPDDAHSFKFFDLYVATVSIDGEEVDLMSAPMDITPRHWYGGTVLTKAEVAARSREEGLQDLLQNMEMDGVEKVILTRNGGWQYFRSHHVHVPERSTND